MSIELVTKYSGKVDEIFSAESRANLLTNQDYDWSGAHTVKVYSVTTANMHDYGRDGPEDGNWSRYGEVEGLDTTTQELTLSRDRSFTFAIDRMDEDETKLTLSAASALARQLREVAIPEVDAWAYGKMVMGAGTTINPTEALSSENIYDAILTATEYLDNSMVPETVRFIVVTPQVYTMMKKSLTVELDTDIPADMIQRGVIAMYDSNVVIRVPAVRLPANFGFMICHPTATTAPVKLESFKVHQDPPGISGALVEGRIVYDAFVLNNKKAAIYVHKLTPEAEPEIEG